MSEPASVPVQQHVFTTNQAIALCELTVRMTYEATQVHVCYVCGRDLFGGKPFSAHADRDECILVKCAEIFQYDPIDPID